MKIAIYGRETHNNTSQDVQLLFQKLSEFKVEMHIYEPFYKFIKKKIQIHGSVKTFNSHKDIISPKVDYMLSLGGDGTFLSTLSFIRNSGIPVLGINTGTLGFLANVAQAEIAKAIEAIVYKKFTIEKRALIKVCTNQIELFGEINYGLNELTISKKGDLSMITIHAYINGDYLGSYHADGLIIATPTGSTAYSLSCGGPIVMPGSQNFVLTPIAPHNLNVRPLVISDSNVITLKIEGRSKEYLASLDSTTKTIDSSVEFTITKADFYLNIIKLENQNFFNTIRNKLLWGLDSRN
jgi:NAD+ kinase